MSVYEKMFGLRRIINASGTMTHLGGSLMPPQAIEAMVEAAKEWVNMRDLLDRAGEVIAKIAGVRAAFITSGASAGIVLSTAACMTGLDKEKMNRLPDTEGMKNEVVLQRGQDISWERCFRTAGAKVVVAGGDQVLVQGEKWPRSLGVTAESVEAVINDRTCALGVILSHDCVARGVLPTGEMVRIAHKHELPVIVDAASEIPYVVDGRLDLGRFNRMGADLVIYSGGKAMCGPNDTGIILGREDLVKACALQASPNQGIGRGYKVNKEQIVGLVAAVQYYANLDFNEVLTQEMERARYVVDQFKNVEGVRSEMIYPDETGLPVPRVRIMLDEEALGVKAVDVSNALQEGDPAIYLRREYESLGILTVDVQVLRGCEEGIVCRRLKEVLFKDST